MSDTDKKVKAKQLELSLTGEVETPFKKYINGIFNSNDVKELQLENQRLKNQLDETFIFAEQFKEKAEEESEEADALAREVEYLATENGYLNEAIHEATKQLFFMWDRNRAYLYPPHGESKEQTRLKFVRGNSFVNQIIPEVICYLHAKDGKDYIKIPDAKQQKYMKSLWGSYATWLLETLKEHKAKFDEKNKKLEVEENVPF